MVRRIAYFFRLTDDDGLLSLTHLALYVGIALLILGRSIPWTDLSAFVVALGSYRVKRATEASAAADTETVAKLGTTVQALQATVNALATPDRMARAQEALAKMTGKKA